MKLRIPDVMILNRVPLLLRLLGIRLKSGFCLTVVGGLELCRRDVGVVVGDLAMEAAGRSAQPGAETSDPEDVGEFGDQSGHVLVWARRQTRAGTPDLVGVTGNTDALR